MAITWYHLPFTSKFYSTAVSRIPRRERHGVERIVCPLVEYRLAASLIQAKEIGISLKTLDSILGGLRVCGVDWSILRVEYEREPDSTTLAAALKPLFPDLSLEGKSTTEILASAMRSYREVALRRSMSAFAGYPFQAKLPVATAMLLKLQVEDVRSMISAMKLRIPLSTLEGHLVITV
jgi:hypothetical protein